MIAIEVPLKRRSLSTGLFLARRLRKQKSMSIFEEDVAMPRELEGADHHHDHRTRKSIEESNQETNKLCSRRQHINKRVRSLDDTLVVADIQKLYEDRSCKSWSGGKGGLSERKLYTTIRLESLLGGGTGNGGLGAVVVVVVVSGHASRGLSVAADPRATFAVLGDKNSISYGNKRAREDKQGILTSRRGCDHRPCAGVHLQPWPGLCRLETRTSQSVFTCEQ